MQESWSSVECRRRSASTDRAALHLHASQEEVCTGFWSTTKGESTRRTMLQKAKSTESMSFQTKSATSTSTELRSNLEKRSVGLGTSKEIAVQRRDIVAAAFGISTQSLERLLNVVEAIDWENITMLDSQKERLSANLQALTSSPVSLNIPSVLGRIVAPAEQEANFDLIMRDRSESRVFAQLRASADEITGKEVSLGTMSQLEQAAFMSLLITAVSRCDLRTIASSNVAATTEIFYDVAEEKMSAIGVMRRESRREFGSKTFKSSRKEVVQGFWRGERDEERVVKTLKTRMEDFKQTLTTRSATFISETATLGMRKADQKATTSGVQQLTAKEVVSEAFGITESKMDQFFEILDQMDWSNIELGQREHSAISANVRILSDEQQDCSGILGKLRPPKQQEETIDVNVKDSQKARTILTVRAALQSTISSNSNFSRSVSDSEKAVFSNLVSVLASHDLSTIATSSETSVLSIGYQDIPEALGALRTWNVSNSERLSQQIREPLEQVVESFWNTASDEEKVAVLMADKVDSIFESLNTVAASMANESVSRELVRTVQSSGTATVRNVTPQEFVSSAFGISSSSLQKFFEILEKMDWSQVNLPVAQHSAISSNVRALAPPNFNSSSILGKLRPPAPEESSADLKVLQAQKATCILNVKAALDNTITSSESFSRIPDAEKTVYSNLIGVMATDDFSTVGSSSESRTVEVNYSEAMNRLDASRSIVAKNLAVLKTEIQESGENVVQGFWSTASDQEKIAAVVSEKLSTIQHSLHTHAIRTVTESLSRDIRREEQAGSSHHFVKLSARDAVQAAFGITSESVDQFLNLLEKMDWSHISLAEPIHSNISANVRILSDVQRDCSGILGKLRPPTQQNESADVMVKDVQNATTILNVRAALQSTIASNSNFSRTVSDSEKATFSHLVSVLAAHDLSTIATSSASSVLSVGYQNIEGDLGVLKTLTSKRSEQLNQQIREPSEQAVESFWNTASDEEKVAVLMAKKVDSIYESLNTVAASMANESVSRELVRTVQSSGTATVRNVTPQEFVSSAFGISSSSLQKFFEILEKMDWSQVNLPVAQHSAISSNVRALAPPNFNSSSILGKLRPPAPEESSADLKVLQAQKATCILDVKAALDNTITSSESFSRIPDAEKTVYSNLIGVMATDDFSTIGSSSESRTVEVNYSEATNRLDASKDLVAKNLTVLKSELRESSEEVVQGFWSTASNQEKIGAVVSEKLKSIHHSLQAHAIQTVTESLSRDIRREEQSGLTHHFVKLSAREVVQAAFGVSSESVDQLLSLLEKMDWSQISLVQPIHANIAANVRALASSSSQSSGVLGKLIAPQAAIESASREIQEVNQAKCILNVMSCLDSAIAVEPSISRLPEEERAVFSNIIGLIASDKLLTSSESLTSSFGFDNVFELSEARRVIQQANQQSLTQKIRESTEELVQGIWNTATEDEKKAFVVKEKLNTVHQCLNTLAIQMATESVSKELVGSSESLGILRSVHLPTREVVRAAFGISQENVQNLLEVLAKVEWSSVLLPAKEHQTISGNIRALAESKVDVENILGKLVAPEPQTKSADGQVTDSRRAEVAASLKSAVESVISKDSQLSRVSAQEQSVITNLASLMVSHDLTSLSATTSEFGIQHVHSEEQGSAEAVLSSPLSQQFVERVREPIEKQVTGFWSTASTAQKKEAFLMERAASIHATLQTFATSLASETMHREFTATAQSLAALQSIRLTPREILCAAFNISTQQVDEVFRALDSISWAEIDLPVDQKETLNSNLRIVNADVPNVFGQLMSRPEEHQETSAVREEHRKLQFLLNVQRRLEESTSISSQLQKSGDVAEAQTSNLVSILLTENLGQLLSQAVQMAQPNLSDESTATFQIPREVLLNRVLPEASEESVQSFWKTSQLSESTNSTFAEKLSDLKAEFVISAAKQVSTSLTLDYRRKVFNQNSEIIFGDLTRDVVCAAFSISSSTLDEFFTQLEQVDWSQVKLTAKQKSIISANVASLASSQLDALLGKLVSKAEERESTNRSFADQSRLEVQNTFKIQQILLESSIQRRRSEEETVTFSNLVALLSSVDLKAAIHVATFDRAPESLSADASIIPVTKLQQFVRQPEEQVIQGIWSNEKLQKELVEHVCKKIEVIKSILTCYAVAEAQKDVAQSLERADVHGEAQVSRGTPEIVRDAFAVSNQSYFKILKVLGHMETVEIPEKVKETLAKNLAILNLPPVETLIQSRKQSDADCFLD